MKIQKANAANSKVNNLAANVTVTLKIYNPVTSAGKTIIIGKSELERMSFDDLTKYAQSRNFRELRVNYTGGSELITPKDLGELSEAKVDLKTYINTQTKNNKWQKLSTEEVISSTQAPEDVYKAGGRNNDGQRELPLVNSQVIINPAVMKARLEQAVNDAETELYTEKRRVLTEIMNRLDEYEVDEPNERQVLDAMSASERESHLKMQKEELLHQLKRALENVDYRRELGGNYVLIDDREYPENCFIQMFKPERSYLPYCSTFMNIYQDSKIEELEAKRMQACRLEKDSEMQGLVKQAEDGFAEQNMPGINYPMPPGPMHISLWQTDRKSGTFEVNSDKYNDAQTRANSARKFLFGNNRRQRFVAVLNTLLKMEELDSEASLPPSLPNSLEYWCENYPNALRYWDSLAAALGQDGGTTKLKQICENPQHVGVTSPKFDRDKDYSKVLPNLTNMLKYYDKNPPQLDEVQEQLSTINPEN